LLFRVEEFGNAAIRNDLEMSHAQSCDEAHGAQCLSEMCTLRAEQRGEQVDGIGQPGRAQVEAIGEAQRQGQAEQESVRIGRTMRISRKVSR